MKCSYPSHAILTSQDTNTTCRVSLHALILSKRVRSYFSPPPPQTTCRVYGLGAGAVDTKTDAKGNTPLHLAVSWCRPKVVSLLLKHGAKVNASNLTGATPIFICWSTQKFARRTDNFIMLKAADEIEQASTPLCMHHPGYLKHGSLWVAPSLEPLELLVACHCCLLQPVQESLHVCAIHSTVLYRPCLGWPNLTAAAAAAAAPPPFGNAAA